MNKTLIPWCDYSINPVKGLCPMACKDLQGKEYCYARKMYKRFKWNPEIRFVPEVYDDISVSPRGQLIFVGSTIELFGDWARQEWLNFIIKQCYVHPWHTFIFLTKQPQNLAKFSPFPPNCWVGVSPMNNAQLLLAVGSLEKIEARVKFLSLEPLVNQLDALPFVLHNAVINWIIIGSRTQPVRHPERVWVEEIISAADKAKIPVFVKEPLATHIDFRRQEFPKFEPKRLLNQDEMAKAIISSSSPPHIATAKAQFTKDVEWIKTHKQSIGDEDGLNYFMIPVTEVMEIEK